MASAVKRISLLVLLLSFLGVGPAAADRFVPLPSVGGTSPHLQIRFVRYDGGTNGEMVVEVKNTSKRVRSFSAEGIFFVPKGDPEKAPQRLGASGPFAVIAKGAKGKHLTKLEVRPGQTQRLHLEVFCIDSHRSSPNSSTKFTVAKKLLPKKLRQEIKAGATKIYRKAKGNVAKAKSAVQSHMWKTRDSKWIEIEGERVNEKAQKVRQRRPRHRNRIHRRPIQQKRYR